MNNLSNPNRSRDAILAFVRIAAGLLFFQHGAEKLWGFAGGKIDLNFATLHGIAGPIEAVGGAMLILGLGTRFAAFIMCGEMAVAYFTRWAPRGLFPINNGGEESVLFCFLFLWFVFAGAGALSLDGLIQKRGRNSEAGIGVPGEPIHSNVS